MGLFSFVSTVGIFREILLYIHSFGLNDLDFWQMYYLNVWT